MASIVTVWLQINRGVVNASGFWFGSVGFRRDFSVCMFTGRLISVSFQLGGHRANQISLFFSEPTRYSVGFRTWLIFSDAIVHTGECSRNLFKSGQILIVFNLPINLEPNGLSFGSKLVGGFRVDVSVCIFLCVCF